MLIDLEINMINVWRKIVCRVRENIRKKCSKKRNGIKSMPLGLLMQAKKKR